MQFLGITGISKSVLHGQSGLALADLGLGSPCGRREARITLLTSCNLPPTVMCRDTTAIPGDFTHRSEWLPKMVWCRFFSVVIGKFRSKVDKDGLPCVVYG
ncbi:hypothetical protein NL676_027528 [Syzygium grande]|nr:hypothetical protein NL676_027528 [Syzygium grande]